MRGGALRRGPAERSFYGHEVASAGVTPTPTVTTPSYGGVDTDYGIAVASRM